MSSLVLGMALAISAVGAVAPGDHQPSRLALAFERLGYVGEVYLNADRSYLIVQTAPDGRTEGFTGRWSRIGQTGVCIQPAAGVGGKCLARLPQVVGRAETITSDQGEHYSLTLQPRR